MNWRWPAKRGNGLLPWYSILWRCLWIGPIVTCLFFTCLFLAISQGLDTGIRLWKEAT